MPTFPCNVTPRAQITPDGDGKYLVTPEKLNDIANPVVSVTLDETDLYPAVNISFTTSGNSRTVTLQAQLGGENLSQHLRLEVWLTENSSTLAISSTDIETPPTGFVGNQATVVTDANGALSFDIEHGSALNLYVAVASPAGIVYVSENLEFTG